MKTGFVIGKFYPFHLGHMYLLDVARSQCDHLIVWVCEKADQTVLGHVRAAWIRELYPDVEVRLVPDTLADDDTLGWARYTVRVLGKAPDVVFTSEDYGAPYAAAMGSAHVLVDQRRGHIPISGTQVRADALAAWDFLAPPVRAYFAKRIVVVGAESTGTSTLAKALAEHYTTAWVPEYGREYAERRTSEDGAWKTSELTHIAAEQMRRENEHARRARGLLICDTDAFATELWHRRYLGFDAPQIRDIASSRRADLYILTGDEIPFVQDGTRDGEHIRHTMQSWFAYELASRGYPHMIVQGDHDTRLARAVTRIDAVLSASSALT